MFKDDRANTPENLFIVSKVTDDDYKYGEYSILYRVFLTNFPHVKVSQTTPFKITVVDPCGSDIENKLTPSTLFD